MARFIPALPFYTGIYAGYYKVSHMSAEFMKCFDGELGITPDRPFEDVARELNAVFYPLELEATDRFDEVPGFVASFEGFEISLQGIPDENDSEKAPIYYLNVFGPANKHKHAPEFIMGIPESTNKNRNGTYVISEYLLSYVAAKTTLQAKLILHLVENEKALFVADVTHDFGRELKTAKYSLHIGQDERRARRNKECDVIYHSVLEKLAVEITTRGYEFPMLLKLCSGGQTIVFDPDEIMLLMQEIAFLNHCDTSALGMLSCSINFWCEYATNHHCELYLFAEQP